MTIRKTYLDFLRIIAIFFVLFNHTDAFYQGILDVGTNWRFLFLFFTMITRMNVPLFFMISGALLLSKEESVKEIFWKRIFRYIIVIVIANSVIYIASILEGTVSYEAVSVKGWMNNIIQESTVSYWFLYSYLAAMIMLPFIRKIAQNLNKELFIYLVVVHFLVASLVPILNTVLIGTYTFEFSEYLSLPIFMEKPIFYMLAGHYFENVVSENYYSGKNVLRWIGLALGGIAIEIVITDIQGRNVGYSLDYVEMFDYLIAFAVFIVAKSMFMKGQVNRMISQFISGIGNVAFGIYLLDPMFGHYVGLKIMHAMNTRISVFLSCTIYCIISMMVCGLVTWGMKKVPVFRRFL